MRYLLDTTVLSAYFAGDPHARLLLRNLTPDGIAVSIVAYLEAYQGVIEHADPEKAVQRFNAFFRTAPILPISPSQLDFPQSGDIAKRLGEAFHEGA